MIILNRWKELDDIKTPEEWKNITYEKENKRFNFSYVLSIIVICLSLTTVLAYNYDLKDWITSYFADDVEIVENNSRIPINDMREFYIKNGLFLYRYKEDEDGNETVTKVYQLNNHVLTKIDTMSINFRYNNENCSFQYVTNNNDIFAFNYSNSIIDILPCINNNVVYLCMRDDNIISLNINTKEINQITHDSKSVNPIMSPNGKTILINKQDEYWTVYDTMTNVEKKVNDINGYAHSNEIYFIDDYTVSTYHTYDMNDTADKGSEMYVIDLKTLKKTVYEGCSEYASEIELNDDNNTTQIRNYITNQTYSLNINRDNLYYLRSRDYMLFYDEINKSIGYLYSIKENTAIEIDIPENVGDLSNNFDILSDSNELLISDDNYLYFININQLFNK
jgi:hypothetical protein